MRYKMVAGKYKVSCVGIGAHYRALEYGTDDATVLGDINEDELRTREGYLRRAIDAGINYFDSTWRNETEMLCRAIAPLNVRDRVFINSMTMDTFINTETPEESAAYVLEGLDARLRMVQGNYYDCYMMNTPERGYDEAKADACMRVLEDRKRKGDILCTGISTHRPELARAFADRYDIDLIMTSYNFHHHQIDDLFKDYRGSATIIAMKPMIWSLSVYGLPFVYAGLIPGQLVSKPLEEMATHSIAWSALSPIVSSVVVSVHSDRDLDDLIEAADMMHPDAAALAEYEKLVTMDNYIPFALTALFRKTDQLSTRNLFYACMQVSNLLGVEFPYDNMKQYHKLPYGEKEFRAHMEAMRKRAIEMGYGQYVEQISSAQSLF